MSTPFAPRIGLALAAVLAVGCGDGSKPAPAATATSSATAAPSAAPLQLAPIDVRLGGQRIPFRSLLVYSRGGRALHLMASTHALICSDLKKVQGIRAEAGEVTLSLTAAPRLQPDGSESWTLTRVRYNRVTRQGTYGKVVATQADPSRAVDLKLDAELRMPGAPGALSISGTIQAETCGVVPFSRRAVERKQPDLSVKVAGKSFPLRGATFEATSPPKLRLSTEPHGCGSLAGVDLGLTVTLAEKDDRATHLRVEGFVLPTTLAADLKDVAAVPRDPVDGKNTLAIELQGETKIGAYDIALAGIASAEICPPKDAAAPR